MLIVLFLSNSIVLNLRYFQLISLEIRHYLYPLFVSNFDAVQVV